MSDKGAQNPISGEPMWERYADAVERIAVPGGWLFRTCSWVELPVGPNEERDGYHHWSNPVFVPEMINILPPFPR